VNDTDGDTISEVPSTTEEGTGAEDRTITTNAADTNDDVNSELPENPSWWRDFNHPLLQIFAEAESEGGENRNRTTPVTAAAANEVIHPLNHTTPNAPEANTALLSTTTNPGPNPSAPHPTFVESQIAPARNGEEEEVGHLEVMIETEQNRIREAQRNIIEYQRGMIEVLKGRLRERENLNLGMRGGEMGV
jgi:hypothetical protein